MQEPVPRPLGSMMLAQQKSTMAQRLATACAQRLPWKEPVKRHRSSAEPWAAIDPMQHSHLKCERTCTAAMTSSTEHLAPLGWCRIAPLLGRPTRQTRLQGTHIDTKRNRQLPACTIGLQIPKVTLEPIAIALIEQGGAEAFAGVMGR